LTNEKNTDILKKSKELLDALIKKYVPAKWLFADYGNGMLAGLSVRV
jgi:hypothetical protein